MVTALPSIHREFGGGVGILQWTVSAYTMAFGAGILTASALGDRLGRRRIYVVGLALFTLASAACALAPNAAALIGARLRLPESRGSSSRLDVSGLVLVTAGIGFLIWGLVQGGQAGWGSVTNVTGLAFGSAFIAGFIVQEARAPERAMIPLGLFRRITFSAAVSTQFFMTAAIFSAAFLISQFFQFALGDSPFGAGLRFLPWTAIPLLIAPVAGALSDKIGSRALIVPGLTMQGIGLAWIVSLAASSSSYSSYVMPFIIAGVGISMALPSVTAGGLNAVPPELLGKAAGTLNTMQQFGAVVGIAVVTAVFNSKGSLADPTAVTSGFRPALAVSAGLSVLGAAAALGIRRAVPGPGMPSRRSERSGRYTPGRFAPWPTVRVGTEPVRL